MPLLEHARVFRLIASASVLFTDLEKKNTVECKEMTAREKKSRTHGGRRG